MSCARAINRRSWMPRTKAWPATTPPWSSCRCAACLPGLPAVQHCGARLLSAFGPAAGASAASLASLMCCAAECACSLLFPWCASRAAVVQLQVHRLPPSLASLLCIAAELGSSLLLMWSCAFTVGMHQV